MTSTDNTPHPERNRILPARWLPDLTRLVPEHPGRYDGPRLAVWLLAVYLVIVVVRSIIHLAAPDGGAGSIASIDLNVEGGDNIVAMFALALVVEPLLRTLSGTLKPIETLGVAPGAALNDVMGYAMAVVLYPALCPARPTRSAAG